MFEFTNMIDVVASAYHIVDKLTPLTIFNIFKGISKDYFKKAYENIFSLIIPPNICLTFHFMKR